MILESRLEHTIVILLEGRSYSHLFGDNATYRSLEREHHSPEMWPAEMLQGSYKNEENYKLKHTKKTLPVITTLFNEYASIPYLHLNEETDDEYETIQNIFGPQANLLNEIDSRVYAYTPSIINILNEKIQPYEFAQFFNDIETKNLATLSIIESNTYLDGSGWSMCTGGNSLYNAEHKILDIVQTVRHSSYENKTQILLLWLNDGGLPDHTKKSRLANIWITPYFLPHKKIFDHENKKITTKSVYYFLKHLYLGIPQENTKIGTLWQKNLLNNLPISKQNCDKIIPNKITYHRGVSPYKLGHEKRQMGLAERLYSRSKLKDNDIFSDLENIKPLRAMKLIPASTSDDYNSTVGFWLLFVAILLYFILLLGLLYVFILKYSPKRTSVVSSFTFIN